MPVENPELESANRCLRDIVALATLPAVWHGADLQRVAESLAAALFATASPAVVFVALRDGASGREVCVAQVDRYGTDPDLAQALAPPLFEWALTRDIEECARLRHGDLPLQFHVRPLGFDAEFGIIAIGNQEASAQTPLQETFLSVAAAQATAAVRNALLLTALRDAGEADARRSRQLRRLADLALRLNASLDVDAVMHIVTQEARGLIGCHAAIAGTTQGPGWPQAITRGSLSESFASYLPQEANASRHPSLRGCLAVPLVGRDGRNLGLLQLSDKYEGDFDVIDEAIVIQLAQIASVALENAGLVERLRNEDRLKNEFIATLSHELRNPLAPLRNCVELLRAGKADPNALGRVHEIMDRQVQHLVRLVDDLLEISRITHGTIELRSELTDLVAVLRGVIESAEAQISTDRQLHVIQPMPENLVVRGDAVRLAQVFGNLLTNAVRYTDPGGQIRIEARRESDDAVVTVSDDGIGLAAKNLEQIFEMFTQVDRKPRQGIAGLGIGLALVKRLVDLHGGRVYARSDGPGKGSDFVVRLPLSGEALPQVERRGDLSRTKARVLVVDDNIEAAESLALLLTSLGMDVRTAWDGPSALAEHQKFGAQMIILDIGMPGMDGFEVARRIRAVPANVSVKLVALTGWGQDSDRKACLASGFDHHLTKPAEIAALEALVATLHPSSRAEARA